MVNFYKCVHIFTVVCVKCEWPLAHTMLCVCAKSQRNMDIVKQYSNRFELCYNRIELNKMDDCVNKLKMSHGLMNSICVSRSFNQLMRMLEFCEQKKFSNWNVQHIKLMSTIFGSHCFHILTELLKVRA